MVYRNRSWGSDDERRPKEWRGVTPEVRPLDAVPPFKTGVRDLTTCRGQVIDTHKKKYSKESFVGFL